MTTSDPTREEPQLWEQPEIHDRRWKLLALMCLSLVMVVMSVSGLNVAIPTIQRELEATATDLQWIVDAYGIIFAGLLLMAGALGDKYGRKRALQFGLVVFGLGSIIAGLATDPLQVIAGRAVSGIGAAFVMPATLSLVTTVFPPQERVKAIAIWAGFAGAGGAIGPLISGGLLNGGYWWGSTVLVNVPIAVLTLLAVSALSPTSKDPGNAPLDPVGALLSLIGLSSLLYGIIEGQHGWTDPTVMATLVVGVVTLVAFMIWESRTKYPMLPMSFFRVPSFSISSSVITVAFFMLFGFFFLITQYLQFVKGYSPLRAAFATLPVGVTLVVVSPRSAALGERIGARKVVSGGFVSIAIGFFVLSSVGVSSAYVHVLAGIVLLGIGLGSSAAVSTGQLMSSVPHNKAGVGSAVNDTTRELGGAFGIAILGSILNAGYRNGVDLSGLGLSPRAAGESSESIGGALRAAADLPAEVAQSLRTTAAESFTDAFSTVMIVAAIIAVVAAVLVMVADRSVSQNVEDPDLVDA